MLNDDLFELYDLMKEEAIIKNTLIELKHNIKDIRESIEEIKERIITNMNNIKHKYVQYKDINLTLVKKPQRSKLDKAELKLLIEEIIEMDLDTLEKRDRILEILKPKDTGLFIDTLSIKRIKKNKKLK